MADVMATTTMGGETALKEATINSFASHLRGGVLLPGHDGYDGARQVWNGVIDKRPALIVRCADTREVIHAVRFARDNDLLVSVRGGGHNLAGKAVCDGGLMIDLYGMKSIRVDPGQRTARVAGGALLGDLDAATQKFGLATTAGVVTHTGVGGLTLGGGVGRLARKHGLACDNLRAVEVVTAAGELVRASATENADLFWGLRGGGGNFGIVTAFEFGLHPVGPEVLGGILVHRLADAKAALQFYGEYSRTAPDELSADASFFTSPDGELLFSVSVCYIGPIDQGERVLQPLRRFGPPLSDEIRPMAYTELQAANDAIFPNGLCYYWKSHFLKAISADVVDVAVSSFARVPSPRSVVFFQQFGGAVSRIGQWETAFCHRDTQYDNVFVSIWSEPSESEEHKKCAREWWDAMKPFALGGEYINNLGEEGEDRVRASYGANYERLVALKNKYDPTNFFRLNANIRPTV